MASYSMWHQKWHATCDKSFQAFSRFSQVIKASWAWRPGNEANQAPGLLMRILLSNAALWWLAMIWGSSHLGAVVHSSCWTLYSVAGDGLSFWDLPWPWPKVYGMCWVWFSYKGKEGVLLPSRDFHGGTHLWAWIAVALWGTEWWGWVW